MSMRAPDKDVQELERALRLFRPTVKTDPGSQQLITLLGRIVLSQDRHIRELEVDLGAVQGKVRGLEGGRS